ncbi:MAG: pro-sigmaK processing inhibitor BofA family protein [Clostridia bacterium]|nr:pro-sigmaK processing inhibitor BofA family protein [Clostridia bacterium]
MEVGVILATLILLVVLFLIVRILLGPLKVITRVFIKCSLALLLLVGINIIGQYIGFHLPVNPVSVVGVGTLGLPGLVLVTFMNYLFV